MSTGAPLRYRLPEGWTLRMVATAMVQEWLPPFRAEPPVKAARWVVQSVMEKADQAEAPLWEPGISTTEYERRVDETVLAWVVRATAGRGKGNILARFSMDEERPELLQLIPTRTPFPETLFDAEKVEALLREQGVSEEDGLFAAILAQQGFQRVD